MKSLIKTVRLEEADIPMLAAVLARAFFDDPSAIYIEPDAARRAQILPVPYEMGTRYAHRFGEVHTTAEHIEGGALWLVPGSGDFAPDRMAASGADKSSAAMGREAFHRFMKLQTHMGSLRAATMPSPHWYLTILGVEPSRQGMGIGSQLIQPVLKRADESGLACYLETMKSRNVAFYRQHGFEIVVEGNLPDNGPYYWTMCRRARRR